MGDAHFMKDMVYFTCKDADESLDDKGRIVPGNVKQIIFHNPSACGVLGRAHNFGCIPTSWYGEHDIFDKELQETVLEDNMYRKERFFELLFDIFEFFKLSIFSVFYTGRDPWEGNRQCENSKSGQVCSCQPFVALTV